MPKLSETLRRYLPTRSPNNADFVAKVLDAGAEIQVLPQPIGEPVEGKKNHYVRDGIDVYPIRYPRNSATDPDWRDPETYPAEFYDRVGSTGHTPTGSLFAGFDFDSITGHAAGVGVPDAERERIAKAVEAIDYVEVRRSTGGAGLHLFVWLDRFPTKNHTEHAAVARAVLGKMCHDADIDFEASVDVVGGNFWFWRHDPHPDSFRLLKSPTRVLTPDDVPNWRDHVEVVARKRSRVKLGGLTEDDAANHPAVARDDEHVRILRALRAAVYVPDHRCYRGHTADLARVHHELNLTGAFETLSAGTDLDVLNCYLFLRPGGSFFVVRYGDTKEHALWDRTAKGQACIVFNAPLKPEAAARAVEAIPTGPGAFTCGTVEAAQRAARFYGIDVPPLPSDRPIGFKFEGKKLTVETPREKSETPAGWAPIGRKLKRQFDIEAPVADLHYDGILRHLNANDAEAGWIVCLDDGRWAGQSKDNCRDLLSVKLGMSREATSAITGACVANPYNVVVEPLQPEWLSGRRYNPNAKRLIVPVDGVHPHFDLILEHVGAGLDDAVASDAWCERHGIRNGADYLRLWAASMVRRPKQPLPYLFFWSNENNTGKSSFHRALGKLFEGGDGGTDVYLCLMEKFNQAMAGCVLGYIEDKGLNAAAYERLKGWVDAPTITIRAMHTNAYSVPNYGHYVHTANDLQALTIAPHDLRVVVNHVAPLDREVPWSDKLSPALDKEAPAFLATLLALSLPPAAGRLYLPVVETADKRKLMALSDKRPVADVLADAVARFVDRVDHWTGFAGDLLAAIGSGPWTDNPPTFASHLLEAADILHDRDVVVWSATTKVRGQRRIFVGKFRPGALDWTEPPWSPEELADDETRVGNLL